MLAQVLARVNDKQDKSSNALCAPNTLIPYQPGLVADLRKEHRRILTGVRRLLIRIKNNDMLHIPRVLLEMKKQILNHFVKENNALLVYIKALHQDQPTQGKLVRELKREMAGVQATVFYFFDTYLTMPLTGYSLKAMGQELYIMGKMLYGRFRRQEKTLYPLYTPPGLPDRS